MNRLGSATSPYLLQHKDNPVHWWPWGPEAFAEAKLTGKPVLLSVGYSACHWCHVMAHESFETDRIAAQMNDQFINIKMDREEHPDVDHIYQSALALLGQQGGWPLTMFLDADGKPFFGGTYFPPDSRWGRPGFTDVMDRIHEVWTTEPQLVDQNRSALTERLSVRERSGMSGLLPDETIERATMLLSEQVDFHDGGTKGSPKFPQPYLFELFLRRADRDKNGNNRVAVTTMLDAVCEGGIYDHLAGGFARYSTDAEWLVPHFEKMLYDNALLLKLLAHGFAATEAPLYKQRAIETVDWLKSEMREPSGAFAAALDADSEGVEGKYYVWDEAEIDALLSDASPRFKDAYDVSAAGNFEGRNILHRRHDFAPRFDDPDLARGRAVLLKERRKRVPPGKDDKILSDWNGMTIEALAFAGVMFDRPGWIELARDAYEFLATTLWRANGRLTHSWRAGRFGADGLLDDYAWLATAALRLYEVTGEDDFLDDARHLTELAEYWFAAPQGGYYQSPKARDADAPLILRPRHALDAAIPSGNATMLQLLAGLHHLTGLPLYAERAEKCAAAFLNAEGLARHIPAGMINGLDTLRRGRAITIPDPSWLSGLRAALDPRTLIKYGSPAMVCAGNRCSAPAGDMSELKMLLYSEFH